jgi:hypothetical protein
MLFESGITIFRVNQQILIENTSDPGFDKCLLYSIQGNYQILLLDSFVIGTTYSYAYGSEGQRVIKIIGEKEREDSKFYSEKGITVNIGYAPTDVLLFSRREDQSSEYDFNYVQQGICFEINRFQSITGTSPLTYSWNYGGAVTFSNTINPVQTLKFDALGYKFVGVTVSNLFGTTFSNLEFVTINSPILGITSTPSFGNVRTGETLIVDTQFVQQNGHTQRDIAYRWNINGVTYSTSRITLNYDLGITVGVTLSYFSRIFNGFSGSTFGTYAVSDVPGIYSIHVSNSLGNDSWAGKTSGIFGTDGPVRTLTKAAELARGYSGPLDIDIKIAGGTYQFIEQSFYLTGPDSGVNRTITYKPLISGAKVIISGGYTVSPSLFTLVTAGNTLIYDRLKPSAQGNVYQADVSMMGISFGTTLPNTWNGRAVQNKYLPSIPELFFDNEKMTVARWPNKSSSSSDSSDPFGYTSMAYIESVVNSGSSSTRPPLGLTNGVFKYESSVSSVINRWNATGPTEYDGIWLFGFWQWDWSDDVYQIKSINKITREIEVYSSTSSYGILKNIPCSSPGNPFAYANPTNRRFFAFNILEELDSPGEYFLDRKNKKLYFWPPYTIGATSNVVLSSIQLAGDQSWIPGTPKYADSVLQMQSNLNTLGVNASIFKFYKLKNVVFDGLEFYHMSGSAIQMDLCENVQIKNCKIHSPRKNGIVIVGGKNNIIDSCEIYNSGLNAVIIGAGDRRNLIPANNVLQNSRLIGSGKNSSNYGGGLALLGVGNIVRKNIIANSCSKAIMLHGNDHIIEYNNFSYLTSAQDDTGGIYVANNVSDRNTTIRYNLFNNVKTNLPGGPAYSGTLPAGGCPSPPIKTALSCGIYIDEFNCGVNILSNVFYNCGATSGDTDGAIFITHGLDHLVKNNIIIDSNCGIGHWYSNRELWNTNGKAFKSGNSNIGVGALQQIINVGDEPWYEDGSPSSLPGPAVLFGGRNYTPYSFFASGYGREGTWVSTKGLLNKVDVTGTTWTNKYPQLAGEDGMIRYDPENYLVTFNQRYPMKNYLIDNVFVNVGANARITQQQSSGLSGSTFEIGNYFNYNNYDIFVDKNSLNFKLTERGLNLIRGDVPDFADIPFEEIPVL